MVQFPFQTVICALDSGREAREALALASQVARSMSARLIVAHAEPPPIAPGASAAPAGAQRLAQTELEYGESLVHELVEEVLGPEAAEDVEYHVALGDPAKSIVELASASDSPLLVTGSRGRGALRSLLFGSVSTNVVSAAPCPVLVVPTGGEPPRA